MSVEVSSKQADPTYCGHGGCAEVTLLSSNDANDNAAGYVRVVNNRDHGDYPAHSIPLDVPQQAWARHIEAGKDLSTLLLMAAAGTFVGATDLDMYYKDLADLHDDPELSVMAGEHFSERFSAPEQRALGDYASTGKLDIGSLTVGETIVVFSGDY